MSSKPFDHDRHLQRLQEVIDFLEGAKPDLAMTVVNARRIHLDFIGRMAEGRRVFHALEKLAPLTDSPNQIIQQVNRLNQYVVQPQGPWIGSELFPRYWPDGKPNTKGED